MAQYVIEQHSHVLAPEVLEYLTVPGFTPCITGQGESRRTASAVDVLGASRIVFGLDYAPAPDVAAVIANVRSAPILDAANHAIFFDNAHALLRRHGVGFPQAPGASDV